MKGDAVSDTTWTWYQYDRKQAAEARRGKNGHARTKAGKRPGGAPGSLTEGRVQTFPYNEQGKVSSVFSHSIPKQQAKARKGKSVRGISPGAKP
jgi:hypothetical protein